MKTYLVALMLAVGSMSLVAVDAEAKRMGSGSSSGRQSSSVTKQSVQPTQQQALPSAAKPASAAAPAAAAAKPASPWKGILGGALLGLGLGALLSSLGMGEAMAGMIGTMLMLGLLAAAAFFVYRMLTGKRQAAAMAKSGWQPAPAGATVSSTPEIGSRLQPAAPGSAAGATAAAASHEEEVTGIDGVPSDFDTAGFLRHGKTQFIRLQAAWDRADANDLRDVTTPEFFAELKQQLLERGASANHTDVVSLDARLLGIETGERDYLASIHFSGMIREQDGAPAEPFAEVWNLVKPLHGSEGWLLAGIQQLS